MKRWALLVVIGGVGGVGCAADFDPSGDDGPSDAGGCDVYLAFTPDMAIASASTEIRATANVVNAPGVLDYTWQVTKSGGAVPFTYRQTDHSAIAFIGADPGAYHVMVAVSGGGFCPTAQGYVNVGVDGAGATQVRLRVYPAAGTAAPPQEQLKLIPGGAGEYSLDNVAIDPGVVVAGSVKMGTTAVPAYLRFIPLGARDAYIETFANVDGLFATRTLNQVHDVLVVPSVPGLAPRLVTSWTPGMPITVDAGTQITGTVRAPGGAALANAQVQLRIDGVPSTLATTDAAGAFAVRAQLPVGVPELEVEVSPPVASGLPRVAGASLTLSATLPITVDYSAALARRDVGGAVVRRNGAAQANVPVKIVGTIGNVATITTGTTTITANGEVRIPTQTTASGALPAGTLAPAVLLSAVSQIGAHLAVGALDLSAGVPAAIDAPVTAPVDLVLQDPAGGALPNALVELTPTNALRLAGAGAWRAAANGAGVASLVVPAGGSFDVRVSDPQGRGAPVRLANVATASLAGAYKLDKAKRVLGTLVLTGNPQPVGRATVQILCTLCAGIERTRPLAEGSSSSAGAFDLAVVDAGVVMPWQ